MTRILLLNSDSPSNKGDQLILKGNIALLQRMWPNSEIWACSQFPDRDKKWFGINFLPVPVFSLNPIELLKVSLFARKCDYVFWGGGEFLKDYTNKISILYWFIRILAIWIFNKNIYGMFQGIGPTKGRFSRRMIAATVSLTKCFFVRDHASFQKLVDWGIRRAKLYSSFDPALLLEKECSGSDMDFSEFVPLEFTNNIIGVSLRRWFHYEKGKVLPYHWSKRASSERGEVAQYKLNMARLLDRVVSGTGKRLLFFPMFNSPAEGDDLFCSEVVALMKKSSSALVLDSNNISPDKFFNLASICDAFVTTRLHASILATVAEVPATNLYYIDKGRLFFEQIEQESFCFPIEDILYDDRIEFLYDAIVKSLENSKVIINKNKKKLAFMRKKITNDFESGIADYATRKGD